MYNGKKVICITPAGRVRYLEILRKYVTKAFGLVDQWHLWCNTSNQDDIAYMYELRRQYPGQIEVITIDDPHHFCSGRIRSFFPHACDPEAIYVRFDDDIVWVQDGAIENMVKYRIENPQYFLIGGNVLNNPISDHRHQKNGSIVLDIEIPDYFIDMEAFRRGEHIHVQFFNQPDKDKFHFPSEGLRPATRFGIQFISWIGERFSHFGGLIPHVDEENWLTIEAPEQWHQTNAICGNALAVHYAYTEQRRELDAKPLLQKYKDLAYV